MVGQSATDDQGTATDHHYRVFDSRGTLEVCITKSRARAFAESGYPVEIWDLQRDVTSAKQVLHQIAGTGPAYISGGRGEKVGRLETTDDGIEEVFDE